MKHRRDEPGDAADMFTVVMPEALRERFERWLRRENLRCAPIGDTEPMVYLVSPDRR